MFVLLMYSLLYVPRRRIGQVSVGIHHTAVISGGTIDTTRQDAASVLDARTREVIRCESEYGAH